MFFSKEEKSEAQKYMEQKGRGKTTAIISSQMRAKNNYKIKPAIHTSFNTKDIEENSNSLNDDYAGLTPSEKRQAQNSIRSTVKLIVGLIIIVFLINLIGEVFSFILASL